MRKVYEKYNVSNLQWIGSVPQHWKVGAVKHCFKFKVGFTPPTSNNDFYDPENGFDWVTISDIDRKYIFESKNKISKTAIDVYSKEIVPAGSLLYSFKLSVGKVAFAGKDIFTNEAIFSILPDENLELSYYYYCLPAILIHNANENIYGAKIFNQEVIKNSRLPIPPKEEQTRIAQYLDHHTSIIDELIQQKEKLIELLKEKRQAVINEAVTKGLNPNAKMKDSGIEWLGVVPEKWDVTKLKFLAKLNPSKSEIENRITGDDVVSFLPMEKVEENWSYDKNCTAKYSEVSAGLTYFKEGDIIMAKITPCFENGKAAILESLVNGFGFGSTEFHTIRPFKIDRRYLFYVTRSDYFMSNGESFMTGSAGQKRVPTSFISDFFVPIPNPNEQNEIALFIESHIKKNNKISNELKLQIEKLKEYRQSIISEAVTGKIDVRDWQPNKLQIA